MSRSNSCLVCTYLIEPVAGIMTGYTYIKKDTDTNRVSVFFCIYKGKLFILQGRKAFVLKTQRRKK